MRWLNSLPQHLPLNKVIALLMFVPLFVPPSPSLGWTDFASARGELQGQGAQVISRTFPETGKTLRGKFLVYWEQAGGLARHGYPISDEMQEMSDTDGKMYTVQYFERSVFELHTENQPPYDVQLQLLGAFRYNQLFPVGLVPSGGEKANTEPGAQRFPQTGKTVGGKFLEYWERNGGLSQFGYPISNEFEEYSPLDRTPFLDRKPYIVQYFERAVFELHPQNPPSYQVLLAQLGTFRWRTRPEDLRGVTPQFQTDIPEGEYIPLYPGTVLMRNVDLDTSHIVEFEVPADVSRVRAFYEYILPKYGWSLLYRTGSGHYSWTDPKGLAPWHLDVDLSIGGRLGSGRAGVDLLYKRYPDANKIPLYPGAQNIEVSAGGSDTSSPAFCRNTATVTNTTFLTMASPTEVESYYKALLPTHGWWIRDNSGSIQSPTGVRFTGGHTFAIRMEGRHPITTSRVHELTITAQAGRDQTTKITHVLKACESDFSGP